MGRLIKKPTLSSIENKPNWAIQFGDRIVQKLETGQFRLNHNREQTGQLEANVNPQQCAYDRALEWARCRNGLEMSDGDTFVL